MIKALSYDLLRPDIDGITFVFPNVIGKFYWKYRVSIIIIIIIDANEIRCACEWNALQPSMILHIQEKNNINKWKIIGKLRIYVNRVFALNDILWTKRSADPEPFECHSESKLRKKIKSMIEVWNAHVMCEMECGDHSGEQVHRAPSNTAHRENWNLMNFRMHVAIRLNRSITFNRTQFSPSDANMQNLVTFQSI